LFLGFCCEGSNPGSHPQVPSESTPHPLKVLSTHGPDSFSLGLKFSQPKLFRDIYLSFTPGSGQTVVVAHAFNASTQEAEADRYLSWRPAWSIESSRTAKATQKNPVLKKTHLHPKIQTKIHGHTHTHTHTNTQTHTQTHTDTHTLPAAAAEGIWVYWLVNTVDLM
jgi:hypothetical protein